MAQMGGLANKLAYFLEAEQLAGVFVEWPDDMNVVLCLDDSGGCEVLVYHQGEGRSVLRKVAALFGRSLGEFMVVPEMRGYPTRKVLFSEEQKMLSIVADAVDLPEAAQDYAINYRYAQDQGLNPDTMKPRPAPRPETGAARETAEVITPTFRHRARPEPVRPAPKPAADRPAGIRPRLRLTMGNLARAVAPDPEPVPAPRAEPQFPPGYAPAAEAALDECHIVDGQIGEQDGAIRLILSRERLSVNTAPIRVTDLCFRDDFARFMIPRGVLGNWRPGQAAVIDVPVERFPVALARRLKGAREAEVTLTPRGIFVAPGAELVVEEKSEPAPRPVLRRVVTPLRAAMLALVAVGAATGAILSYMEDGRAIGIDWRASSSAPAGQADPEVTRFIGTPLDLIGTMAREEAGR